MLKDLAFPLNFGFKIVALANQVYVKDANQKTILYVHQKLLKLKEEVNIYSDETKSQLLYTIRADRVIDFSAEYKMYDVNNNYLGSVKRRGARSLWRATYDIFGQNSNLLYTINEDNPWAKVLDGFIGVLSNWLFQPKYNLTDASGQNLLVLSKNPSFFEASFSLEKRQDFNNQDSEKVILGFLMMTLLERARG